MSETMISKMRKILENRLEEKFGLSKDDSAFAIQNSSFELLLKKDPEYVGHYSVDDWAEDTYLEFQGLQTM